MSTTNLNIRTDKEVKEQAEEIFAELGLTMTSAINIFLKTVIRENGIPFDLRLDAPSEKSSAIKEGKRLLADGKALGYSTIEALKAALEI